MPGVRHKHKSKRWWISEAESRLAYAYAQMYYEWQAEYRALEGLTKKSDTDDNEQSSTERDAIRRESLFRKMELIDQTLIETDGLLYRWLKMAVTTKGMTYDILLAKGMPCAEGTFYERRRKFYHLLSKKI